MKKITLLALLLVMGWSAQSQVSFEASTDYGKLMDVTYDATVQNKMYAATQGNHIIVSTNNGANWSLLYSHPTNSFLKDMKLALNNTALSFATDEGLHFLNLATNTITQNVPVPQSGVAGASPSYISSYSVYSSNVMLVDTGFSIGFANYGKTFYTIDGGANWAEIYFTESNDNVFINNVAIAPNDVNTLFLARGNGDGDIDGGLWISKDAGITWDEHMPGVTFSAMAFNPTNANDMLLGTFIGFGIHPENLFRSADGGNTWAIVPIAWTDETLNNIPKIVFHPTNPNKIMVLDENETVRSDDGGLTWTNTIYPVGISMDYYYGINASYNPFNESQIAITTDLFPQFSSDGGATLTQIKVPFYNVISTSVARYSGNPHLYYSSNGGRLHKDITSGVTSAYDIEQPNSFNPKKNYMVADPNVAGRVFTYASMGFFGGNVNVSTDYGATKTDILQSFADDMQELVVDPSNSNIIYVSMRSGEGGSMFKVDFSDLNNVVSTEIFTPEMNEFGEGVVTGIVVNATDSNILYIAKRTKVFKSVDGGQNWVEMSTGLENIVDGSDLIWDMAANPLNANQLTIGTNLGIFTTTDGAETWTQILADLDVKRIKHSPLNDGVIVGSVFSTQFVQAQIVYSIDNGANWTTVTPQDIKYVQSYAMDYDFAGNSINAYLATTDLGVMKYEINDLPLATKHPLANTIGIFPNPAADKITVFAGNSQIKTISVYSLTGQKILESNATTVDVSALNNGIYLVKAIMANGDSVTEKLVKK